MREFEQPAQLSVHHLIAELYDGVDWVLVEGFKQSNLLKLEVWRAQPGKPVRYPDDDFIVAIVTDQPAAAAGNPAAGAGPQRPRCVAQWLVDNADRFDYNPEFYV
jgi:molybdopterin-guanine dinucleotide biosynthesis protein B